MIDSDENLTGFNEQNRQVRGNMETVEQALNEINAYTKNDLTCIEECVKYVKYLYDNSKKQYKSLNLRSQYDLQEQNEDLKDELKSMEKKYARKLEKKDSEILELQEELESLEKAKSQKDNKDLKARNLELQNELNERIDVSAELERKIKCLMKKNCSLTEEKETLSEKFEKDERQMKKEIKGLKETISNKQNEIENVISDYDKRLEEKQCAIDTIKKKMLLKRDINVILKEKLDQSILEINEYKLNLKELKERNSELQNNLREKNNVCEQLERQLAYLTKNNVLLTEERKTLSKELEKCKTQTRKELDERISSAMEYEKKLKEKQCAIDNINEKFDIADRQLAMRTVELDDYRKKLKKKREEVFRLRPKEIPQINNIQNLI